MAILVVPSKNYPTIQAAVSTANPFDTISITTGVYYESFIVTTDNLTIQSQTLGASIIGENKLGAGASIIANNTTLKNLNFFNFQAGIALFGNNNIVSYCTSTTNGLFGIIVIGDSNNISQCGFDTNDYFGVELNGDKNIYNDNRTVGNKSGGVSNSLSPLTNSIISNSIVSIPSDNGINLTIDSSNNNTLTNNSINSTNGLFIVSENNKICNNTLLDCKSSGIIITNKLNRIYKNSITNSQNGIIIKGDNCTLTNNAVMGASENAFLVIADKCTLCCNLISKSSIGIQSIGDNNITKNCFCQVVNNIFTLSKCN